MRKLAWVLIPTLMVLGACGGTDVKPAGKDEAAEVVGNSPSASPSESTKTDLPDSDTVKQYAEGINADTIEGYDKALSAALPGSPAAAYATYLKASMQSQIDGGTAGDLARSELTDIDGGFESCASADGEKVCYKYTDFTGRESKVANLSVNDKPLDGRLTVGSGAATPISGLNAKATFLAAFETSDGKQLLVVLSVKSGKGTKVNLSEASYRSQDGRQSQSSGMHGPSELGADSVANYTFAFPTAKVGGALTLKVYDESFMNSGSVTLKTR